MAKNAGGILKCEEASEIREAALTVKRRHVRVCGDMPKAKTLRLTSREKAVFKGLAKGLFYQEIACELGIRFSTVQKYKNKMFKKLRVTNRSQAMLLWLETEARSRGFLPKEVQA